MYFACKVVLFTIIELFNEEDDVINHHGFERRVPGDQKQKRKPARIFKMATFVITKVVPILAVVFTIIYWAYAIYCYGQS